METRLIIFDFDGVILDTFELTQKIYSVFGREYNIKALNDNEGNPDFFREFFELDWKKTLAKVAITDEKDFQKIDALFRKASREHAHLIRIYDGMAETVRQLSSRYDLAIASNNYSEIIAEHLRKHGMIEQFRLILGGSDGKPKPDPDLLLRCMRAMNRRPGETVFIGDMDGDIAAGRAANLKKVIAVSYGYHSLARLKDADVIIHNPTELIEAVK